MAKETLKDKPVKTLYRSETDRIIGGVCGGLGSYFNIDANLIRLIFILLVIFGGSGLPIYLALWIILPSQSKINSSDLVKDNVEDIKKSARSFASEIRIGEREDNQFWWGLLIVVVGILFLFSNFGIYDLFNFAKFWPLILVVLGMIILLKKN